MSNPVEELLISKGLYFNHSGKDFLIKCLNPDHDDSSPSFRIDKVTGVSHCFSCGFKVNIFKYYGIVDNFTSIKIAKLKEKIRQLQIGMNGVDFPEDMVPMNRPYRGISINTLKEFGAFYTTGRDELQDRLFFPVKDVRNKVVAFVGRHMLSSGNPRYLNYPAGVLMPLFPEVFKEKHTSIVLVEGLFDMLNLYDKGVTNAVCTFGTNSLLKEAASKLLPYKTQGINKIFLLFDGDEAGKLAMNKLEPILIDLGYSVEQISVAEDTDPGEMSQEDVTSLKEYINI